MFFIWGLPSPGLTSCSLCPIKLNRRQLRGAARSKMRVRACAGSHPNLILTILYLFALALTTVILACPSSLTLPSIVSSFLTLLTSERGIFVTINYMQYYVTGLLFASSLSWCSINIPKFTIMILYCCGKTVRNICGALFGARDNSQPGLVSVK